MEYLPGLLSGHPFPGIVFFRRSIAIKGFDYYRWEMIELPLVNDKPPPKSTFGFQARYPVVGSGQIPLLRRIEYFGSYERSEDHSG